MGVPPKSKEDRQRKTACPLHLCDGKKFPSPDSPKTLIRQGTASNIF